MFKTDDLSPTSDLKFAARHCDLLYLDAIKNHRSQTVEKAIKQAGKESGPAIECAWSLVNSGDRLSIVVTRRRISYRAAFFYQSLEFPRR